MTSRSPPKIENCQQVMQNVNKALFLIYLYLLVLSNENEII